MFYIFVIAVQFLHKTISGNTIFMFIDKETQRLHLRPLNTNDTLFILELLNTDEWKEFIGERNIHNHDAALKYIENILAHSVYYYHIIELKSDKKPVGIITLLNRDKQQFPDIGFAFLPQYTGYGYAFEASSFYLNLLIKAKAYSKIIGVTKPDNVKSIKLLTKLGLKYEYDQLENDTLLSVYSLKMPD